jgi:ATPase subunit of ABC transporter with duplicated ATPase domains
MSRTAPCYAALDAVGVRLPDGRPLLQSLTLAFGDERVGLVGANGCGKSTLLRLLAGLVPPSDGSVVRAGTIGYLPQEANAARGATVAERLGVAAVIASIDRLLAGTGNAHDVECVGDQWDAPARARDALARVGLGALALDRPLVAVSGGEGTRVALAALLLQRPDLLLLDEPTNHLDANARMQVRRLVAEWPRGVVVASHDRDLLEGMDRIIELSPRGAAVYGGAYSAYVAQCDQEQATAERALAGARAALARARREVQVARERKARRDARGQKSREDANQSKLLLNLRRETSQSSAGRLAADGERVLDNHRARVRDARERVDERAALVVRFPPSGLHASRRLLEARGVSFAWDPVAEPLIRSLELQLVGPARLAIVGPNGCGKSTLLRLLAGVVAPRDGTLLLTAPPERIAMLEQRIEWPVPSGSLLDNFLARVPDANAALGREALAAFNFRGDAALQPVATLSGGEAMRGALATLLHAPAPPWLLLLDEPTNHLDLDSLRAVERALVRYDGALVVVSHDERFLREIGVTRMVAGDASGHWREAQGVPKAGPVREPSRQ